MPTLVLDLESSLMCCNLPLVKRCDGFDGSFWSIYVYAKYVYYARTPGIVKGNKSLKISHLVWFK